MTKSKLFGFMIFLILALVIIGIVFISGCVQQPTEEPVEEFQEVQEKAGVLEQDESWSGQILITDHVEVPVGVTLTIKPGTVVKFKHYRHGYIEPKELLGLAIKGKLIAAGTPDKPIWFTSDADEPMNGDWQNIRFHDAGKESIIKYAIVEFTSDGSAINLWNSSPTISHSIVRWSNGEGIYLEFYSSPTIEYNRIYQNANNGMAMEQFNKDAIVRYNMIFQNGQSGVHLMASSATIEHNIITANLRGVSLMDNSFVSVKYNTIQGNELDGIWLETGSPSANVKFNTIENNSVGIGGMEFSPLVLNFNNIINRGAVEINLMEDAAGEIDARNNWWGAVDELVIRDKISPVPRVRVDHFPYLTEQVSKNLETGEQITSKIQFDYEDLKPYDLGYTPGDPEKDRFLWVLPDDETRRVVRRISHGLEFPWSLTWGDNHLWEANNLGIFKLDPETGRVVRSFDQPGTRPWGMTFDGTNLWINDFTELKVYEVSPKTGEVISSFSYSELYPKGLNGLAWDGEYLYLTNWAGDWGMVKFDRAGKFIEQIPTAEYIGGGLTFDGEYFWARAPGGKIYKISKAGEIVGWISAGSRTIFDLAWDGKYLWSGERTNEVWDDKKIFKLEILKVIPL